MPCQATNAQGEPCGAPESVVDESGYCSAHRSEEEHRKASMAGGQATKEKFAKPDLRDEDLPPAPTGIDDVKEWLSFATRAVADGRLDAKQGRTLGYLCRAYLDALEKGDVAEDLEELREKIAKLQQGELEEVA